MAATADQRDYVTYILATIIAIRPQYGHLPSEVSAV